MRTIVQLSDLHFGMILQPTLEPLLGTLWALAPDLVIISGDFTQRATEEQFRDANAYIQRMPLPRLMVPGNHDVSLYNVYRRFAKPLDRYARHITDNLAPFHADNEIAVAGINSARSLTFKGGTLSHRQVEEAARRFREVPGDLVRIVVAHHPFDIPVGLSGVKIVRGIRNAMQVFEQCGVDLFLAGHLHLVHQARASAHKPGYNATILQAGTATSSRARGEPNSFFVLRIDGRNIDAELHQWVPVRHRFEHVETRHLSPALLPAIPSGQQR